MPCPSRGRFSLSSPPDRDPSRLPIVSGVGASAEVLTTQCSELLAIRELSGPDRGQMFALMDVVHEGVAVRSIQSSLWRDF